MESSTRLHLNFPPVFNIQKHRVEERKNENFIKSLFKKLFCNKTGFDILIDYHPKMFQKKKQKMLQNQKTFEINMFLKQKSISQLE